MTVLVAYGSKRGGTKGLAEMVADALREEGFTVDVLPAGEVKKCAAYDAVVVGGALYAARWHKDAKRFVRRQSRELRERPTFFFSSGPLDDSSTRKDIAPVRGVRRLMGKAGARGHVTFGGRLTTDAKGFPASAMAKKMAGDWRDMEHVRRWVQSIAPALHPDAERRPETSRSS
jgi:menaquinone-dependent protoporphyrinogen oxidase